MAGLIPHLEVKVAPKFTVAFLRPLFSLGLFRNS
jgi:hypothetical protein